MAKSSQEAQLWVMDFRWTMLEEDQSVERALELREVLHDKLKEYGEKFVYQLERGSETEKLHFQGFIHLKNKDRPKAMGVKLNDELRGISFRACSTAGKEALKRYCMKDDTRVQGPWADKQIYMGQDLPKTLYPWQRDLRDYVVKENPCDREIVWVCDKSGCSGKSKFTKYMEFHHDCLGMCWGKTQDIIYLVCKNVGRRCYIFDLSRTKPDMFSTADLYSAIEDIKNGAVMNTKYEPEKVHMVPPHVIVFANQAPDMEKCTKDRWTIIHLPRSKKLEEKRKRFTWSAEVLKELEENPQDPEIDFIDEEAPPPSKKPLTKK